jgi:hypothetical protein
MRDDAGATDRRLLHDKRAPRASGDAAPQNERGRPSGFVKNLQQYCSKAQGKARRRDVAVGIARPIPCCLSHRCCGSKTLLRRD